MSLPVMTRRSAIIDNQDRLVGDFLRDRITHGSLLSVVSAYFTIYGYDALRDRLDQIDHLRFLYGDPRGLGTLDPEEAEDKAFRLTSEGGLELVQALRQKPLARACARWIERKVDVRTVQRSNFLHGKMYHVAKPHDPGTASQETAALVGSSNFTRRGLGYGQSPNLELNLEVRRAEDREPLLQWFDDLWRDRGLTRDAKQDVLDALDRLGRDYSPEFVYYKTLFHALGDRLARQKESEQLAGGVHLFDSHIWKHLYDFQQHGVISAINRLLLHNGCIVADSVGLGKTFTALGVIKYFESRNERVLVLCPSRLKPNWLRYAAHTAQRSNPFLGDRFGYTVLAHTDLSRNRGPAGDINLAEFIWSAFDLIVIDESHNFRNEGREKRDDEGNLISRSRYRRLLDEVLKEGTKSKVLMLSATPVNTTLRDLRNQIYLMTEKREDAFRELGIGSVSNIFARAQKEFRKWEKFLGDGGPRDKTKLLERLGADFLVVLDAVTIARSRHHIRLYYPDFEKKHGAFPERAKPRNLHPLTDTQRALSYDQLHQVISGFRMAVYMPSQYVTDPTDLDEEKRKLNFDQRDREKWLIGMIRVNLLKRLESSVDSFALTMERMIGKMDDLDALIERWEATGEGRHQFGMGFADEEDDEFTLGQGAASYRLEQLDIPRLRADLRTDRENFRAIKRQARTVTADRDAKLQELGRVLDDKVREAPKDREGRPNRKALVFTTFSDTAKYLYENLEEWARDAGVGMALVAGSAGNRATSGSTRFEDILARFSPRSHGAAGDAETDDEIDIVIATDCLSEGQNLQDCDLVINYDIHWNPVRLMQRLGRIDRIGSTNREVRMVNFWPTKDLDRYLDLKNRVEARMMLADAAGTGADDPAGAGRGRGRRRARSRSGGAEVPRPAASKAPRGDAGYRGRGRRRVPHGLHARRLSRGLGQLSATPQEGAGGGPVRHLGGGAALVGTRWRARAAKRASARRDLLPQAAQQSAAADAEPAPAVLPDVRARRWHRALRIPERQGDSRAVRDGGSRPRPSAEELGGGLRQRDGARPGDGEVQRHGEGGASEPASCLPYENAGKPDPEPRCEGPQAIGAAEGRRGFRTRDLVSDPGGDR